MQTIFRSNRNHAYTNLSNTLLQDKSISWDVRGMLADILSRPVDWDISIAGLVAMSDAGEARVRRMVNDAIRAGYMRRVAERDPGGRFVAWVYIVADDPSEIKHINDSTPLCENREVADDPLCDYPHVGEPQVGNRGQQKKESNKRKNLTKNIYKPNCELEAFETFWNAYPARNGVKSRYEETRKVWGAMSPEERRSAIAGLPAYSKASGPFPQDASKYLRTKRWLDCEVASGQPEIDLEAMRSMLTKHDAVHLLDGAYVEGRNLHLPNRHQIDKLCAGYPQILQSCNVREVIVQN